MGRLLRRRTIVAPPAGAAAAAISPRIDLLESRILFDALPIANPGFDAAFKPGSTTITAMLAPATKTTGFGSGVAVVNASGAAADAAYSDGTSGSSVDVPGWTVSPGATAGIENAPGVYPGKNDNFAYVQPNSQNLAYISQTLSGVSLLPDTTYILTVNLGSQGQSTPDGSAVGIELRAGGVQLTPTDGSSPSPSPGTLPTASRVFVTGAAPPAGNVTISLGLNAPTSASEFDFDNVLLTSTPGSHPTPTPTPVPAINATLSAPGITTLGQSTETVTAVYSDPAGVDLSSLNAGNLQVSAPDGSALDVASFSSSPVGGIVPSVTATYTIDAPYGTWTSADNGTYTITLPAGELSDSDTNTNAAVSTTFTIAAPGGPTANTVDTTFDGGGAERLRFTAQAVAVQGDGKLLIAGQEPGANAGSTQAILERFNVNGSADMTFGSGGAVVDASSGNETFDSVAVENNGDIVIAGSSGGSLLVARYNADGTLDTTFGNGGELVTPVGGTSDATIYGLALGPADNSIVVTGSAGGQFLVDRFTGAGAADPSFNAGSALLFGSAADGDVLGQVAVQSDGAIVAAGASAGSVVVARVTAASALDGGFGAGGLVSLSQLPAPDLLPGEPDHTEGLALDSAGNILVANHTAAGHFGTVRLTAAGSIDPSFGAAGIAIADFGGADDADFVGVSSTGTIIVAGTTTSTPSGSSSTVTRIAVAAFNSDGSVDTAFADNGQELFDSGVPTTESAALASSPALRHPGGSGPRPDADGGGTIYRQVVGSVQPGGKVVVGASQGGADTSKTSPNTGIRRLNLATPSTPTPTPTPAPLPTGTLAVAVSAKLPSAVIGGAKAKSTIVVTIRNGTDHLVSGPVSVVLYVSQADSLSGATTLTSVTPKLKLKAGQSKAIKIRLSRFPAVSDGAYFVLAGLTAPDASITGATGPMIQIAAPFVAIQETGVRPLTLSAVPGKAVELGLTLKDAGNIIAAGATTLTILGSTGSSGEGQVLASVPLRVKLGSGASRTYRVKFRLPPTLAADSYYLTASLNVTALGDDNAADGVAVSATPLTVM